MLRPPPWPNSVMRSSWCRRQASIRYGRRSPGSLGPLAGSSRRTFQMFCDVAAEIGLDDLRILLHVGRRSLGDFLAVVEHEHAVAHAHHELHVMLDQQNRRAVATDI